MKIKCYYVKTLIVTALVLTFAGRSIIEAQEGEEIIIKYPEQYLFADFEVGKVAMKTGKDLYQLLNYSVVLEKMMVLQKGQVYEVMNYKNIDTIYLGGKKFIPFNKVFVEVAVEGKQSLFIQYTGRILGPSSPAAYGGKSDVSSSNYISYLATGGEPFRMKDLEELNIKKDYVYWTFINNEYKSFISRKQFLNYFPERKNQLNQLIRQNRIKFDNPEGIKRLLNYCNQIM